MVGVASTFWSELRKTIGEFIDFLSIHLDTCRHYLLQFAHGVFGLWSLC